MSEITEMIRVRINPELKKDTEIILKGLGLAPSDVIRMLYRQIVMQKGIPFDVKIPNSATLEAMRDVAERRDLESFDSHEEAFKSLGI